MAGKVKTNVSLSEDCRGNGRGRPRMTVKIAEVGRPRKRSW